MAFKFNLGDRVSARFKGPGTVIARNGTGAGYVYVVNFDEWREPEFSQDGTLPLLEERLTLLTPEYINVKVHLRPTGSRRRVTYGDFFRWPDGDVGYWDTQSYSANQYEILEALLNGPNLEVLHDD